MGPRARDCDCHGARPWCASTGRWPRMMDARASTWPSVRCSDSPDPALEPRVTRGLPTESGLEREPERHDVPRRIALEERAPCAFVRTEEDAAVSAARAAHLPCAAV